MNWLKRIHWPSAVAYFAVAFAGVMWRRAREPDPDWRLLGIVAGDSVWIDVGRPLSHDADSVASWSLARWKRVGAKPGTFVTYANIDCGTRRIAYGKMPIGAEHLAPIAVDTACAFIASRAR